MIPNYQHRIVLVLVFLMGASLLSVKAQDSTKAPTILGIQYYLPANQVPYLKITTKRKEGRIFEPVPGVAVNVYFGTDNKGPLLGKVVTASNGAALVGFPPALKATWDSLDAFSVYADSDSGAGSEGLTAELTIKKAILVVDTANVDGARSVTGELKEKKGNTWVPVKEIDMSLRIKRLLGNLSVGSNETYTSDSTGIATATFKRDSLPGDEKGNLTLVAKVDDNDTYGNLLGQKVVPWGVPTKIDNSFFKQRTLWSTRFETPIWLLFLAYGIGGGVWIVILYLIRQLVIIKKLGRQEAGSSSSS
ncbi:MAG: hypothetical protein KGM98_01740 [Bacteroidota bacterium]|nr:hypothetical protein [Bacteroidota bacterium]